MIVYLDSSAIVKRVLNEEHADALRAWLDERADDGELITSTLGWIEVTRAMRRRADRVDSPKNRQLDVEALSGIAACPMSYEIVALARRIGAADLRTLAAIHCATATYLDADVVVTYDDRLLEAARANSLCAFSPGVEEQQ